MKKRIDDAMPNKQYMLSIFNNVQIENQLQPGKRDDIDFRVSIEKSKRFVDHLMRSQVFYSSLRKTNEKHNSCPRYDYSHLKRRNTRKRTTFVSLFKNYIVREEEKKKKTVITTKSVIEGITTKPIPEMTSFQKFQNLKQNKISTKMCKASPMTMNSYQTLTKDNEKLPSIGDKRFITEHLFCDEKEDQNDLYRKKFDLKSESTNMLSTENESFKKNPLLVKDDNPNLFTFLVNNTSGSHNHRNAASLSDEKDVNYFLQAVRDQRMMRHSFSNIPKSYKDISIFRKGNLRYIVDKCRKEIKISENMDKFLEKEKNKEVFNHIKKFNSQIKQMHQQQDQVILENDSNKINIAKSPSEKVFIYDDHGEGKFISSTSGNGCFQKLDLIAKISNNWAFFNRKSYINQFNLDNCSEDPEFIFDEEIEREKKQKRVNLKIEKDIRPRQRRNKCDTVDKVLESTQQQKTCLLAKVSRDIEKINKKKLSMLSTEGVSEVSEIFFLKKNEAYSRNMHSTVLTKAKSMNDIQREVFRELDRKAKVGVS